MKTILGEEQIEPFDWEDHLYEFWLEDQREQRTRATEVLCTKAGEGKPVCCDKEMQIQEPKPLPSSD